MATRTLEAMNNLDPFAVLPELEGAWMTAWMEKDLATCDGILDDEFLVSSSRGVLVRKSAWLASAMNTFNCHAFEWLEILVRPFENVALVHAKIRQVASVSGQDWSGTFMLTDAWVMRGPKWKVVSRHGTGPLSRSPDRAVFVRAHTDLPMRAHDRAWRPVKQLRQAA